MTRLGALTSGTDIDPWTRQKDFNAEIGIKAEIGHHFSSVAPVSQRIYGGGIYLYTDEVITNIIVCVEVAGAGTAPTNLKLGLWSSAATPVCLAVTADLAADTRWTASTSYKVCALTAPYTILASGLFYAAFWINGTFATTNLQLITSYGSGQFAAQIGSAKQRFGSVKTGATTMAVAETGTYAVSGSMPWLGVS